MKKAALKNELAAIRLILNLADESSIISEIRSLLRDLWRPRANWQPIETAPKDGTEILLCRATSADGKPIVPLGMFCQVAAWWNPGGWTVYTSMPPEPRLFFVPTHWMPIPPNPLEEQA